MSLTQMTMNTSNHCTPRNTPRVTIMANQKHVEGVHDFEAAGLGSAPYQEIEVLEDPGLGFCCDACGQAGLRWKHIVENAEGETFGVGSDCIQKADPDLHLELKRKYGVDGVFTEKVKVRAEYFMQCQAECAKFQKLVDLFKSRGNQSSWWESKARDYSFTFGADASPKGKQLKTLEKKAKFLQHDLNWLSSLMPGHVVEAHLAATT
jgi:hypothetical protein